MSWEDLVMTRKTFFNKGIYKSTVKRFWMGSALYFIILFMITGMGIMLSYSTNYTYSKDILLRNFLPPAFVVSVCVPTIVAALVFRYVHSKKMSVFFHSMPSTRLENYVSSVLASLTLMTVPVLLNTLILIIMNVSGYSNLYSIKSCFIWMGVNLLTCFILFAFSSFIVMITGNSLAVIAFNVFIYAVPPVLVEITEVIFEKVLYGYVYETALWNTVLSINPVACLSYAVNDIAYGHDVNYAGIIIFALLAVLVYVLGFFVYKLRKMESCEDVAAFKMLNPIFKYTVTFAVTWGALALFMELFHKNAVLSVISIAIISVVTYFACEMILKKQVKVWYSYKGFLGFAAVFLIITGLVTGTSVFGYETYVPDAEEIESAAIYNYYYNEEEPFTQNEEINKFIVEVHSKLVEKENITVLKHYDYDTRIHIRYNLSDGRVIRRRYGIDEQTCSEIMDKLYTYPQYKYACEEILSSKIKNVVEVNINNIQIMENVNSLNELLDCIQSDVLELNYTDLHLFKASDAIGYCEIEYVTDENYIAYTGVSLSCRFVRTLNWLNDKGYEILTDDNKVVSRDASGKFIVREPNSSVIYLD